jgi:ABC-type lipoprotein export system ATPase subunit
MVTHDPRFMQYADRTVHLFDGRIVDDAFAAASRRPDDEPGDLELSQGFMRN